MKRLIALMLAIAAAGLSATPAAAQLANTQRTSSAGFQWDDGVQTLNWSTATIVALGFIGGGAIIEDSTERIRHIRCDGSLLEFQIRQSDGSYLTVSANEATAFTGLLLPSVASVWVAAKQEDRKESRALNLSRADCSLA